MPVRWADGHFFLQSLDPPGDPGTDIIADTLEAAARAGLDEAAATDIPADDYDARLRVVRQIVARQGQSAFRAALLEAYHGRCAITGCDAAAVLEAAHLRPYRGPESNTVPNGLLLRPTCTLCSISACLPSTPRPGDRSVKTTDRDSIRSHSRPPAGCPRVGLAKP